MLTETAAFTLIMFAERASRWGEGWHQNIGLYCRPLLVVTASDTVVSNEFIVALDTATH